MLKDKEKKGKTHKKQAEIKVAKQAQPFFSSSQKDK